MRSIQKTNVDANSAESVEVTFEVKVAAKNGVAIYRGSGGFAVPALFAPENLGTALTVFSQTWREEVEAPLYAELDAYRRPLYERAKLERPLVAYPADIDVVTELLGLLSGPRPDLADQEELLRQRAAALASPPV